MNEAKAKYIPGPLVGSAIGRTCIVRVRFLLNLINAMSFINVLLKS